MAMRKYVVDENIKKCERQTPAETSPADESRYPEIPKELDTEQEKTGKEVPEKKE